MIGNGPLPPTTRSIRASPRSRPYSADTRKIVNRPAQMITDTRMSTPRKTETNSNLQHGIPKTSIPHTIPSLDQVSISTALRFLEHWRQEESQFRSLLVYAESTFVQAKAISQTWPQPNPFLSSIAYGSFELVCQSLKLQYPFLMDLLSELHHSLFTTPILSTQTSPWINRYLEYFQHGQTYYQQVQTLRDQIHALQNKVQQTQDEVNHLKEQLQKQHVTRMFERVQTRAQVTAANEACARLQRELIDLEPPEVPLYPHFQRVLHTPERGTHLDLTVDPTYQFQPCHNEMLLWFNSIESHEAMELFRDLWSTAIERQLPVLSDMILNMIQRLPPIERRGFLEEYLKTVSKEELQHVLDEREDWNPDQQQQVFLGEMKKVLGLEETEDDTVTLPSEQTRVSEKVCDLVDLIEDVATEISLQDISHHKFRLSDKVLIRLKEYQSTQKRIEKAPEIKNLIDIEAQNKPFVCGCMCGKHRLITFEEEQEVLHTKPIEKEDPTDQPLSQTKGIKHRRRSSARQSSHRSKRNSIRSSQDLTVRLFPLNDVCALTSQCFQLYFSQEYCAPRRRTSGLIIIRESSQNHNVSISMRSLAKQVLIRKYGAIKSIADMYLLQLERSIVYHDRGQNKRCGLYMWFMGLDKLRIRSKDYGFFFFIRVIKITTLVVLKLSELTYSDIMSVWNDIMGDGDTSDDTLKRTIMIPSCLDITQLCFPVWMQSTVAYIKMKETYQEMMNQMVMEVEVFLKMVLDVWYTLYELAIVEAETCVKQSVENENQDGFDQEQFCQCIRSAGIEREIDDLAKRFQDLIQVEQNEKLAQSRVVTFIMETKYLCYDKVG